MGDGGGHGELEGAIGMAASRWVTAAHGGAGHDVDYEDVHLDFVYLLFLFTVPAAVKDPKHCNYITPFIIDMVNNIPKEWFGNGFCDFACGLDVLICTDFCP